MSVRRRSSDTAIFNADEVMSFSELVGQKTAEKHRQESTNLKGAQQ